VDSQAGVGQGQEEGAISQRSQSIGVILGQSGGQSLGVMEDILNGGPRKLGQALAGPPRPAPDEQLQACQIDFGQAFCGKVLVPSTDSCQVQPLGGRREGLQVVQEPSDPILGGALGLEAGGIDPVVFQNPQERLNGLTVGAGRVAAPCQSDGRQVILGGSGDGCQVCLPER
jgi:hypothetical protein